MKDALHPEAPLTPDDAQRFAEVAMATDAAVGLCLKVFFEQHPANEDAIVSGAMTALVRFGIERQNAASQGWAGQVGYIPPPTVRDVFAYFGRYVQRAAEILLTAPTRPNA